MNFHYKIAVVAPTERDDFYCDAILDGLFLLQKENPELQFYYPDYYPHPFGGEFTKQFSVSKEKFAEFAKSADLVILSYGKYGTDYAFIESERLWNKTVYVDGSEIGGDKWRDPMVQLKILRGEIEGPGTPNREILEKCRLYFKREKPYVGGMLPFPLGIESRFSKHAGLGVVKDIDFAAMFGQEIYPITRRYTKELTREFCDKNGFTCHTEKTYKLPLLKRGPYSPEKYYKIWARTKVGICTAAAGYDARRFWEILGNNCLIIAERTDLFPVTYDPFPFKRIFWYDNLFSFVEQLERVGDFLRNGYDQGDLEIEYQAILKKHSTKARVLMIINEAKKINLLS